MKSIKVKGPGLTHDLLSALFGLAGVLFLFFSKPQNIRFPGDFFIVILAILFIIVSIGSVVNLAIGRRETFIIDESEVKWRQVFGKWKKVPVSEIKSMIIIKSADLQGSIEIKTIHGSVLRVPENCYACGKKEIEKHLRALP